MNSKNSEGTLFFIAGILFLISAIIKKDYMSIPLGCCFIVLGISRRHKEK